MFSTIKSPFDVPPEALSLEAETEQYVEPVTNFVPNLEIKELEVTDKGIRLKYERFNQTVKEEGFYPKRGECSANYSDRIDSNLKLIAKELLTICGLSPEIWDNQYLAIAKISFFETENENGLRTMAISAKIKSRNELLNAPQAFSVPKIYQDVLLESNLKSAIAELILDLKDFYYGKVKYEQTSLFSESLDAQ